MPATNVKSEWVGGNLVFYDKSGNIILTFDGTNRRLTVPEASIIDFGKFMKVATGSLAAGNANAFALAWQNPEAVKIIVHKVMIDRTTAGGTADSVLDVGVVGTATDTSDTIIDGLLLNTTGVADNIADKGASGTTRAHKVDEKDGTNDYITGKILVAHAASLAGKYYIFYTLVAS